MSVSIDLTGKNAIVTGGGDGIGKETAFLLAEAGANVFIADLNGEGASLAAEEIRERFGVKAWAVTCNVAVVEDAKKLAETAEEKMGRIDILNHIAGVSKKVDFLEMGPMTFTEFLLADHAENYVEYLSSIQQFEAIPDAFFAPLSEKLKHYFVTGGMPESVLVWTEDKDPQEVDKVLSDIITSYESDFGKHAPVEDVPKIRYIWQSLPSQLAKENKKFLYSVVKPGARAREYENALNWLRDADIISKVNRISKPGLPLSAYDDLSAFKVYAVDVGILRRLSHLPTTAFAENNRLFTEFKGALTENFVHQSLIRSFEVPPRYWTEAPHEVDFIIQKSSTILPIEAKAGENVKATSIKRYEKEYPDETPLMVRLSMRNLSFDGKMLNVPLFMVDELDRLLTLVLR